MPNWATVTRKIYGSKENLQTIKDAIVKCETAKEPLVKNGFGNLWLGCIVNALGGDWEKVACRGEVTSYCECDGYLLLESMEAWGELSEFRHFIEDKFKDEDGDSDVDITYYCSEPGMGVYCTNDPDCDAVYMDVWSLDDDGCEDDIIDSYEADSTDDAIAWICETFFDDDSDFDTLEEAEKAMRSAGYKLHINRYEYQKY